MTILAVPGLDKMSLAFREKLARVSGELGLDPSYVAAVISAESGFVATAVNPSTGASGLIQFLPSTAKVLGTTVEAIRNMSAIDQLDLVKKYFGAFAPRIRSSKFVPGDYYVAVFMPALLGLPSDHIIGKRGEKVYDQNAGLDPKAEDGTRKGFLTVGDVRLRIERIVAKARGVALPVPLVVAARDSLFSESSALSVSSSSGLSEAAVARLRRRVQRYLRDHPEGVPARAMRSWVASVRRLGGFTKEELDRVLKDLMREGKVGIAGGVFYRRDAA